MAYATPRLGLRERKKERTRHTIIDVATRLFEEQGYSETTLAQIADVAEIAPSTFFNYFPSKVDIVFGLTDAVIDSARTRIVERPLDESASEAIVSWLRDDLHEVEEPYADALRRIPQIIHSVPELVAEERLRFALLEDVFAEGFGRELGESPDGIRARVLATIALRGILDVWNTWYKRHADDADFDLAELLGLKAEYVENALQAGLATIAVLPGPLDAD